MRRESVLRGDDVAGDSGDLAEFGGERGGGLRGGVQHDADDAHAAGMVRDAHAAHDELAVGVQDPVDLVGCRVVLDDDAEQGNAFGVAHGGIPFIESIENDSFQIRLLYSNF